MKLALYAIFWVSILMWCPLRSDLKIPQEAQLSNLDEGYALGEEDPALLDEELSKLEEELAQQVHDEQSAQTAESESLVDLDNANAEDVGAQRASAIAQVSGSEESPLETRDVVDDVAELPQKMPVQTRAASSATDDEEPFLPTQAAKVITERATPPAPVEVASPVVQEEAPITAPSQGVIGLTRGHMPAMQIDLKQVFAGAPLIYSILLGLSVFALALWIYLLLSLRTMAQVPLQFIKTLRDKLNANHYEEALNLCLHKEACFFKMVATGISARKRGLSVMVEAMNAEGKRATVSFWQKLGLLSDVAIIAPMIGLLGTVLGMFYAFYDMNRSMESVATLFDGLGVSVGTTVAGLLVSILAMSLHSVAKFRITRSLARVENEAKSAAALIDSQPLVS